MVQLVIHILRAVNSLHRETHAYLKGYGNNGYGKVLFALNKVASVNRIKCDRTQSCQICIRMRTAVLALYGIYASRQRLHPATATEPS